MYIVYRYICVAYLQRLVEQTGSSTAVQEVVVLLHVAVREPLGQVETVNAKAYSDYSVGGGGPFYNWWKKYVLNIFTHTTRLFMPHIYK